MSFILPFRPACRGLTRAAVLQRRTLWEHYPGCKVIVVDSLAASMGQGLMLSYAVKLKEEGKTLSELTDIITRDRLKFCHNFTVNDLFHLHRGGRVSKMTAVVGMALGH